MYKDHGADFQIFFALILFSHLFQKIPISFVFLYLTGRLQVGWHGSLWWVPWLIPMWNTLVRWLIPMCHVSGMIINTGPLQFFPRKRGLFSRDLSCTLTHSHTQTVVAAVRACRWLQNTHSYAYTHCLFRCLFLSHTHTYTWSDGWMPRWRHVADSMQSCSSSFRTHC